MDDLYQMIQAKTRELETSVKMLRKTGTEYAEAERTYKMLLAQACFKMRAEGQAVGMIELTVYGQKDVATARFKRDVAEAVYKANQEAINATKLQLRLLEGQIQREWGAAGKGDI